MSRAETTPSVAHGQDLAFSRTKRACGNSSMFGSPAPKQLKMWDQDCWMEECSISSAPQEETNKMTFDDLRRSFYGDKSQATLDKLSGEAASNTH